MHTRCIRDLFKSFLSVKISEKPLTDSSGFEIPVGRQQICAGRPCACSPKGTHLPEHSQRLLYQCNGHCLGRPDAVRVGRILFRWHSWQNTKSPYWIKVKLKSAVYVYLLCVAAHKISCFLTDSLAVNVGWIPLANSQRVVREGWQREGRRRAPHL